MSADLLTVSHLQTKFCVKGKENLIIDDVSFKIKKGETLCLVGESGCGKSVTSLSIMRLLGSNGKITNGSILFDGKDLVKLSPKEMCNLRGDQITMIFQEPITSLNPLFTVGFQLTEVLRTHLKIGKAAAHERAVTMLKKVGIADAERIFNEYPHMLSGGMRQRVMIAMALTCNPKLLIADEPTTALDVTVQSQILDLIKELKKNSDMSVLFITHDLGVVAEMADRVIVMYAGEIVEEADVFTLFKNPLHSYTKALIGLIPCITTGDRKKLEPIKGSVPSARDQIPGCRFSNRCQNARTGCNKIKVPLVEAEPNHFVRCRRYVKGVTL